MLLRGIAPVREKSVYDQVVEGVADHAKKIKVGSGLEPETQMGRWFPKNNSIASADISNRDCPKAQRPWPAATRLAIADTSSSPQFSSTLKEDMKVVQEEIFGPVVAAMPFTDPEEIILAPTTATTG